MINKFYNTQGEQISFTRQQASNFAKRVADDFNPLHNEDAKRFCVPGDLLFSVILEKSGLSQHMKFNFSGMVTDGISLSFPTEINECEVIKDSNDKVYVNVTANGETSRCTTLIQSLINAYVGFSGHTFPHLLCDLMKKHQVMINPARPMVMYESMELNITDLTAQSVSLELSSTTLHIDRKRGNACLAFNLYSAGKLVGNGKKHMVLSGLRPYCEETIARITTTYLASKEHFFQAD